MTTPEHAHAHAHDDAHGDVSDQSVFTQEFWDERYAASERVWSGHANQRLVELVGDLPPAEALDVGCGEGADVIWLAERGWTATGADVSPVALERARRHAEQAGVGEQTTWRHVDLVAQADRLPAADLVTAMYVHVPDASFDRVYTAVAAAVRPGGTLLVAGHHPDERHTDLRNPQLSHLLFGPERVTCLLGEGWTVELAEARTRGQHTHDGREQEATDTVVLARRAAS